MPHEQGNRGNAQKSGESRPVKSILCHPRTGPVLSSSCPSRVLSLSLTHPTAEDSSKASREPKRCANFGLPTCIQLFNASDIDFSSHVEKDGSRRARVDVRRCKESRDHASLNIRMHRSASSYMYWHVVSRISPGDLIDSTA